MLFFFFLFCIFLTVLFFFFFVTQVLAVFGAVVVISWVTPFFLVVALPLAWLYQWIQRYYLESTREMQRLDSISKSPIFGMIRLFVLYMGRRVYAGGVRLFIMSNYPSHITNNIFSNFISICSPLH